MALARYPVEANAADMERVYQALRDISRGAERAINGALNKTVSKAQTRIVDDVYKELNLTKKHETPWSAAAAFVKFSSSLSTSPCLWLNRWLSW